MRRAALLLFGPLALGPSPGWGQGDPVGPEFRVNTYTSGTQSYSRIAADDSGNFVVVWHSEQDGSGFGVFGQRYDSAGAPLGPEFRVNTYTTSAQGFGAAARDPSGNFVVVWMSSGQDGSGAGVFGQRYAGSGTPLGPEFGANASTTSLQGHPAVAADAAGNFVVVWRGYLEGPTYGVFGQRYNSTGVPLGPEFRVNTSAGLFGPFEGPAIASDASGNFVVTWESPDDVLSGGIFGQRYGSDGAPLGGEFRVNTYTTTFQSDAAVAASITGDFVVVWTSGEEDQLLEVFGQRYASTGAPLGPAFRVNTYTTGFQYGASVVTDASGNFVVVWSGASMARSYGVFGQRFASTGAPLGPEFQVNTYTTQNQGAPSVAADAAGNFVVVWHSDTEDGSSFGVFGQRYNQMVPVELLRFGVE